MIYNRPSFYATGLSGTLLIVVIILFFINFSQISKNPIQMMTILSLLAIGFGIHAENHYKEEIYYDWNPFVGKWLGK